MFIFPKQHRFMCVCIFEKCVLELVVVVVVDLVMWCENWENEENKEHLGNSCEMFCYQVFI